MLYNGEQVGDGNGPECDVAVDPIDGTTLMAKGMPNAIAVMAVAERGAMYDPSAVFYMEKLATGPDAADVVDITAPVAREHPPGRQGQGRARPTTSPSASSTGRGTSSWSQEVREAGARIKFITDGDVAGAIMAAREGTGVDLLLGIGGTPEGIIAACALKCLGGAIQGKLWPKDDDERQKALDAGHDLDRVLHTDDLVAAATSSSSRPASPTASCCAACATAPAARTTQSLVMRSQSGTIRSIESQHPLEKLRAYSAVPFDRRRLSCALDRRPGARRRRSRAAGGGGAALGQPVQQRPPAAGRLPRRQAAQPQVAEHGPAVDDDLRGARRAAAPRPARSCGRRSTVQPSISASTPSATMTSTSPNTVLSCSSIRSAAVRRPRRSIRTSPKTVPTRRGTDGRRPA